MSVPKTMSGTFVAQWIFDEFTKKKKGKKERIKKKNHVIYLSIDQQGALSGFGNCYSLTRTFSAKGMQITCLLRSSLDTGPS